MTNVNAKKKIIIFNVQYNRVVYELEDFIFSGQWEIAEFFFLIILSELTDQCVIAIYRQGSSALLVHLVNVFPLVSRKFNYFFFIVSFIENPPWPCSKNHFGA